MVELHFPGLPTVKPAPKPAAAPPAGSQERPAVPPGTIAAPQQQPELEQAQTGARTEDTRKRELSTSPPKSKRQRNRASRRNRRLTRQGTQRSVASDDSMGPPAARGGQQGDQSMGSDSEDVTIPDSDVAPYFSAGSDMGVELNGEYPGQTRKMARAVQRRVAAWAKWEAQNERMDPHPPSDYEQYLTSGDDDGSRCSSDDNFSKPQRFTRKQQRAKDRQIIEDGKWLQRRELRLTRTGGTGRSRNAEHTGVD